MVARDTCARAAMAPMEAWWKSPVRESTARAASRTASRRTSASEEDGFAASSGAGIQTDIVSPGRRIPGLATCQGETGGPARPASGGRDDALPFQIGENLLRALL